MKHILTALDFSSSTQPVIDAACRIGRIEGATLHLLHVEEPIPEFVGYDAAGVIPLAGSEVPLATENKAGNEKLDQLTDTIRARGLQVTGKVVQGTPAAAIIEEARSLPASMIVMGSHGHGALHHLLVGSATEGVLKHSPCPVLVVPLRD